MSIKTRASGANRIGVFVDISKTLTRRAVLSYYADHFSFSEQFAQLEKSYESGSINSEQFSTQISDLFRGAKATKTHLLGLARKVEVRDGTSNFLEFIREEDIEIFLVSATPDFFVREFAEIHGVPIENCLFAKSTFDGETLVAIEGVSASRKQEFVKERAHRFRLMIGVGDNDYHDGPFIGECDLKFIVLHPGDPIRGDDLFLFAISVQTVKSFIKRTAKEYLRSHSLFYHIKFWLGKQVREKFWRTAFSALLSAVFFLAALAQIYDVLSGHFWVDNHKEAAPATSSSP